MLEDQLQRYFAFSEFRPGQKEIIESILAGRDTLALMPTGAGKSLCFQLPALVLPGLTVIISPLIALMKNQVDSLTARGIPATFLNSSLDLQEQQQRLAEIEAGKYKRVLVIGADKMSSI